MEVLDCAYLPPFGVEIGQMRLGLAENAKRIKSCKKKNAAQVILRGFGDLALQECFLICVTTPSC